MVGTARTSKVRTPAKDQSAIGIRYVTESMTSRVITVIKAVSTAWRVIEIQLRQKITATSVDIQKEKVV